MTHYISKQNNKIIFGTNSLDRMVIDNNGNIGIGTTIPTSHLDIHGNIVSTGITCTSDFNMNGNILKTPECVYARRDAGNITSDTIIVFNKCDVNTGNNYNTSTGIYTCPTDGYYFIDFHGIVNIGNSSVYFRKNSTKISSGCHANHTDSWSTVYLSQIMECSANDTIDVFFDYASGLLHAQTTTETALDHALNGMVIYRISKK